MSCRQRSPCAIHDEKELKMETRRMRRAKNRPKFSLIGVAIFGLILLAACGEQAVREPSAFGFGSPVTGAELSTVVTSPEATLAGFDGALAASVSKPGTLVVNGKAVGATAEVKSGDKIAVRLTSSAAYDTAVSAEVTIMTQKASFSVRTRVAVTTPGTFTFGGAVTGVEPSAPVTSPEATLSGFDGALVATISEPGVLIVNGDEVVGARAEVKAGDVIRVLLTASANFDETVSATVTVNNEAATFSVSTRSAVAFTFGDPVTGVGRSEEIISPLVKLAGFGGQITVTVSGPGVLTINGVDVVGPAAGAEAGDEIAVRLTASPEYNTTVFSTVTVEGTSAVFSVTTRPRPIASFSATESTVEPGAQVTLNWVLDSLVDIVRLTSTQGDDEQLPAGTTSWQGTAAAGAPSVTYTLTVINNATSDQDSAEAEVAVPLWVCTDETYALQFPDTALEAALRALPGFPESAPITCAEMHALEEISTPTGDGSGQIVSLIGLQHAINLKDIELPGHAITSLAPLAGLTQLTDVFLDRNRSLFDLSPLQSLVDLEMLSLWDVGPVLSGEGDEIDGAMDGLDNTELDKIAGLANIQELYISSNNVTDLNFLSGMSDLRVLYAMNNDITDFAPLADKAQLRTALLGYQRTPITQNVDVLTSSPHLAVLGLEYGRVQDTTFLTALGELWEIRLQGNRMHDAVIEGLRANNDFPVGAAPTEALAGPTIENVPTLKLWDNCLDTDASSPTATWISGLRTRTPPVAVEGFNDEDGDQEACSLDSRGPSGDAERSSRMNQELEQLRNNGEIR